MDWAPSMGAAVIWSMRTRDVVAGELGGAELLVEGLAGGLALVPPGFGFGEPGGDLLVDAGVERLADGGGPQGEQVAGSAGPVLGLADLLGGGQVAVVAAHDAGEDGFGGGLLVGLVAGGAVLPVMTWAVLAWRPRVMPTYSACRDSESVTRRWAVSTVRPWATWTLPA